MIARDEKVRTISVTDFKAHCTEQLRTVEKDGVSLAVTRHGKVIALVRQPESWGYRMAPGA